ncbi:MAG TPA: alginate export family protein [Gemmatimonadales bacterium]
MIVPCVVPRRARLLAAVPLALALAGTVEAQRGVAPTISFRTRAEAWDWFDAGPEGRYAYSGSILRAGAIWRGSGASARFELAVPVLLGLPDDATRPPPAGALGLGANYYAANDGERNDAHLFPKQAWIQLGRESGHRLRIGRTEFADGAEAVPASPTLAAVKAQRISQRLLGPFGWSHVGRSYDGGLYAWTGPGWNATLLAARPTSGAFDANGWKQLDMDLGYAAITATGKRGDVRLFALYSADDRRLPKTDNRPAPVRTADSAGLEVVTIGGHLLSEARTRAGTVDFLAWGALQTGSWGAADHRAHAVALEAGIQPRGFEPLRPWLRAGVYRASGDPDPGDGRHETFYPVLPTPRVYARTPFYTTANLEEAFVSLAVRPGPVSLRSDARFLRLHEALDLWYAGGGAFEEESFGNAGRAAGTRPLATLLDLSLDWRASASATVSLYGARVLGRDGIDAIYGPDASAAFGYLEIELRR